MRIEAKPEIDSSSDVLISDTSSSYLLQPAALGAHVGQRVVLVDVSDHRGHFVSGVREQWNPADHLGHPQRRVHIQSAEIIVDGQELYGSKEKINTSIISFR